MNNPSTAKLKKVKGLRLLHLLAFLLCVTPHSDAQEASPILFIVGNMMVERAEFEKAYLSHVTSPAGGYITVDAFLDTFTIRKLKVAAALDARLDTTTSFRRALAKAMSPRVKPAATSSKPAALRPESESLHWLSHPQEAVRLAQIYIHVPQKSPASAMSRARQRIDSIAGALRSGADFSLLAERLSDDRQSAQRHGVMGWFGRNQLLQEVEAVAFRLSVGETSQPFSSVTGWHILRLLDRRSSDEVIAAEEAPSTTMPETAKAEVPRELFDSLLIAEQQKNAVWRRAATDPNALAVYFKKHKKKYRRKGFKPKKYTEVADLVTADLEEEMEKQWISDLRQRYPIHINQKVLRH